MVSKTENQCVRREERGKDVNMKTHDENVHILSNSTNEGTNLEEQDCGKERPLAVEEGENLTVK
jgi:hypothetical protein